MYVYSKSEVYGSECRSKCQDLDFYIKCRVLKLRFLAFSRGPGGFRELREAGRNHFHLSSYLTVSVVISYVQNDRDSTHKKMCLLLRLFLWVVDMPKTVKKTGGFLVITRDHGHL